MAILVARTNLPVWDFQKLASLPVTLLICHLGSISGGRFTNDACVEMSTWRTAASENDAVTK